MDDPPASGLSGIFGTEAQLRYVLAAVPDAMIIIDEMGMILAFSGVAEKIFGYAEDEVVGQNVSMLMPPPDRERHDGYLKNYRDSGVRKIIGIGRVTAARHRDGNVFPIELSVGELWVDGKRIFTGFIHDLTALRQADTRLRGLQTELAHVGRLSEMGTLASALAHELNQPLTAIASYCEGASVLLRDKPGRAQLDMARGAIQDAAAQSIRAGQIVKRMREFLSHGDPDHRVESLARIITEANALALVGTREDGIEVQVEIDPRCENVFVDRIQIQQVLCNLIHNANEAMKGSPMRLLTISTVVESKRLVVVSVEDTGSGVSELLAPRLFEPFIGSKSAGMGIGLSICRTIVEAHGGQISFESVPGGGTAFRFTLPIADVDHE